MEKGSGKVGAMRHRRLSLIGCLLFLLSCAAETVTRAEWERMSRPERELYVRSLVGGEKAKDAKGGEGKTYDRPAAEYVSAIDAAYVRGDQRPAHQIFAESNR